MSKNWLNEKVFMLAKEVEKNKEKIFMLLELEDKRIKEKDVVIFNQDRWSESKLDLLNKDFNYRIILKDIKYDGNISTEELSDKFFSRISDTHKEDIMKQVEFKGVK